MLLSRSGLFLLLQALIALIFFITDNPSAWDESTRWWTLVVSLANVVSIYLLMRLYKAEGKRFFDIFKFSRATWKQDLLWFIGLSIIAMPIVAVPREPLAKAIFGDAMIATNMLFRPIPTWAFVLSFLIPSVILLVVFSQIKAFYGYRFNLTYQMLIMSRTLGDITVLMLVGSLPDYVQGLIKLFWVVSGSNRERTYP